VSVRLLTQVFATLVVADDGSVRLEVPAAAQDDVLEWVDQMAVNNGPWRSLEGDLSDDDAMDYATATQIIRETKRIPTVVVEA
jgi:hypothetical protein